MFGDTFRHILAYRAAAAEEAAYYAHAAGCYQLGQWLASLFEGWAL